MPHDMRVSLFNDVDLSVCLLCLFVCFACLFVCLFSNKVRHLVKERKGENDRQCLKFETETMKAKRLASRGVIEVSCLLNLMVISPF